MKSILRQELFREVVHAADWTRTAGGKNTVAFERVTLRDGSRYVIKKRRTFERTVHDLWGSLFLPSYVRVPETFVVVNDDQTVSIGQEYLPHPPVKTIDEVLGAVRSRSRFLVCYLVFHPDLFNAGNLFLDGGEACCVDNESFGLLQVGSVPQATDLHCRTRMETLERYRGELEVPALDGQELLHSFLQIPHIDHSRVIETLDIDAKIQHLLRNHSELKRRVC